MGGLNGYMGGVKWIYGRGKIDIWEAKMGY